jgi:CRP-like cAMP-binding protein
MQGAIEFLNGLVLSAEEFGSNKIVARGEIILSEGAVEKNVYLVQSGALRVFLLTELEELTIRFGYKGSVINSLASFITGQPSAFYIQAIRKSAIRVISKDQFNEYANASHERLNQYIGLLELLTVQQIEREIDLLTVSPAERLQRVLKRSPQLFQEIPLKYIASYLRMKPETISRIRNS